MITCPRCHCAAYCTSQHMKEDQEFHAKSCINLCTSLMDYRTQQQLTRDILASDTSTLISQLPLAFIIQPYR